jgi:hypothetical protein
LNNPLADLVAVFNNREFETAYIIASSQCEVSVDKDSLFWNGIREMCQAFNTINKGNLDTAEPLLISSMEKLRNFGFRYGDFEVTSALAGMRRGYDEIRRVTEKDNGTFDITVFPKLKLSSVNSR